MGNIISFISCNIELKNEMKDKCNKTIDRVKLSNKINNDKNSILIIANGPSAISEKYGELIDKFHTIGRINNYVTDKFKDFIGVKTDIWFNGANQGLKKRNFFPPKTIVLIPAEIQYAKEQRVLDRTPYRLGMQKSQYTLVPKEIIKEFEDYSNIKRPTTGLFSILWSLHNYQKVVIHGFDFFIDSKSHYFDNKLISSLKNKGIIPKAKKHNMNKEKACIDNSILDGKLKILNG